MYYIGLVIVALAIGFRYDQNIGWLVLGIGLILAGIFEGLSKYFRK